MSALSFFKLQDYIDKYGCTVFVETGSGHGGGIEYSKSFGFNQIFSVEIDAQQASYLSGKFKEDPRIQVLHGDSTKILENILNKGIDETILFWLDAHFPSADLGKAHFDEEKNLDIRLPLEIELSLIFEKRAKKGFKDVVLVDDLRIYEERPYQAGNLKEIGLAHLFKPVPNLGEQFLETHNIEKLNDDTGLMIITPK